MKMGMWAMICASCGKKIEGDEVKGSMKHPFCINCFNYRFKNDDEYIKFLERTH